MIRAIIAHILNDPHTIAAIQNIVSPLIDKRLKAIEKYIESQKGDGR